MLRVLTLAIVTTLVASQGPPPYYGLPLGAVFYSADGTQGEVYASDPNTLTIVNFYHKAQPGCTTFAAGPPKPSESLNIVPTKDAIMLPVKYRKQSIRNKRASATTPEPRGIKWNVGPSVGNFPKAKSEGIQWSDKITQAPVPRERGAVKPQTAPVGNGIRWGQGETSDFDTPVQSRFFGPLPREPSEFIGGLNVPDEEEVGKAGFRAGKTQPTTPAGPDIYKSDGVTVRFGRAGPTPPRPTVPTPSPIFGFGGQPPSALRGAPGGPGAPGSAAVVQGPKDELRAELGGIVILPSDASRSDFYFGRNESKSKNVTASPLAKEHLTTAQLKPSEVFRSELGGIILLPHNASRLDFYFRNDSNLLKNLNAAAAVVQQPQEQPAPSTSPPHPDRPWFPVEDPRRRLPPVPVTQEPNKTPVPAAPQPRGNSSHDWFPVEDPRNKRPEIPPSNLIAVNSPVQEVNQDVQQRQQPPVEHLFVPVPDRRALFEVPIPSEVTLGPVASEIKSASKLPAPGDGLFYVLPEIKGEDLTVVLPDSYDLTSFEWFGVYDHCKKQRTATVSVHGVKPPKETEIDGLKGWQHDVSSAKIHVLNCNTMLISNFTYTGAGKTDAYLYVGNGDFPRGIIQKARAYIVGTLPDRILQNVHNEDILVRLPPGWKTLDISWISVYNPRDNVSYGHALVPPIVAPPCDE